MATRKFGTKGLWCVEGKEFSRTGGGLIHLSFSSLCSESEVSGTGVAVVVELLLDVDHVTAGVFQLPELGSATEVSKVAELGQPRPGWSICRKP